MKSKVFLFLLVSAVTLMPGCDKAKVDIQSGSGVMTYDGVSYPFDFSTAATFPSGDKYTHSATFTDTGNKDNSVSFSFIIKDDNPEKGISGGSYETSMGGDYTANFSINETVGDYLAGTMNVSVSGDKYTFDFSGTTIDGNAETKTVTFQYTGKIVNK